MTLIINNFEDKNTRIIKKIKSIRFENQNENGCWLFISGNSGIEHAVSFEPEIENFYVEED